MDITVEGTEIVIATIDLPPHPSPYYGQGHELYEPFDDRGGDWFQNPNQIVQQDFEVRIPANPVSKGLTITESLVDLSAGTSDDEYRGMPMGVALDSVALFHGVAAPQDDIRDEKYTFDTWEGHPEMTGVYHHHGAAPGQLAVLEDLGIVSTTVPGEAEVELYGIMCDGTVILGCTELDGSAPNQSNLDAQGGHTHDLTDEEGTTHFTNRYHTHVCEGRFGHDFTPEIQFYQGGCG